MQEASAEQVTNKRRDKFAIGSLLIRIDGENRWKAYPVGFIEGFEFEPGYLYVLKVEMIHLANPPMDSPNIQLKLLSIISKTKVGGKAE